MCSAVVVFIITFSVYPKYSTRTLTPTEQSTECMCVCGSCSLKIRRQRNKKKSTCADWPCVFMMCVSARAYVRAWLLRLLSELYARDRDDDEERLLNFWCLYSRKTKSIYRILLIASDGVIIVRCFGQVSKSKEWKRDDDDDDDVLGWI